ncbi:MAG TPA: hypothetical protein VI685_11675 [Candidatus Angelobacter sp.]
MRKFLLILLPVIFLSALACAQDQDAPKRGPSTPEERKRFVALVEKLEKSPLDHSLRPDVFWAERWLNDIPDINVSVCPAPLGRFVDENYKYAGQISVQFAFGMAAYLIQHPDKVADRSAQYLAGVQEALRTYKSILKSEPRAQSAALDQLVAKEAEGTLSDFVRDAGKVCEDTQKS